MSKLPTQSVFFDVDVGMWRGGDDQGTVGLGCERKEGNGKMKGRLMRSPAPQGSASPGSRRARTKRKENEKKKPPGTRGPKRDGETAVKSC